MTDNTSGSRRFRPAAIIIAVAAVAVLLILRLQPSTDLDDDEEERPAAAAPSRRSSQGDLVALSDESMRTANIGSGTAGPHRIFETVELAGSITADPQRVRRVQARFPGVVQDVRVAVGDSVAAGSTVAIVESDDSLQRYAVKAPIAGIVSERSVSPGEHSGDQPILTITDLSHVWIEMPLFANDAAAVHTGLSAVVAAEGSTQSSEGSVSFVSPIGSPGSQTTTARIVLANGDGRWIPGMAVSVRVRTREFESAIVAPRSAIQQHGGKDVVFVKTDGGFRVQAVQLGVDDGLNVEIRGGLNAGQKIATTNSYVVLAELEKGSQPSDD